MLLSLIIPAAVDHTFYFLVLLKFWLVEHNVTHGELVRLVYFHFLLVADFLHGELNTPYFQNIALLNVVFL